MESHRLVFVDPTAYADEPRLHASLAYLRTNEPIARVESDDYAPFWAVTKYADVVEVSAARDCFRNAPSPVFHSKAVVAERARAGQVPTRSMLHMDGDEHHRYRSLVAEWFLPRTVNSYIPKVRRVAARLVDELLERGEADFTTFVAEQLPLITIMTILGLPQGDHARMLDVTHRFFGINDPDHRAGMGQAAFVQATQDFRDYFALVTKDRRANPTDDLSSVIANARVEGALLSDHECLSYFTLIAAAGHDTTAGALGGGMLALLEYPDEFARLQADPTLLGLAVEEMFRWSTPTKCFTRTAARDYRLRDTTIAAGDWVLLSYVSANFDEEQFSSPEVFNVARTPNKHIAFGFGAHFCLGAQLARMEMRALFSELLDRNIAVELAGQPIHKPTVFVGGLKHLPIHIHAR